MTSPLHIAIRLTPRASEDRVVGWVDDSREILSVRVRALPHEGQANESLIKTLAKSIRIAKSNIQILRGATSRSKLVGVNCHLQSFENWQNDLPIISPAQN